MLEHIEEGDDDALMKDSLEKIRVYTLTIEQFIKLIVKRFSDKISHVRSKALKVLNRVFNTNSDNFVIESLDLQVQIFNQNVIRLRDQSALVRKNALKLFKTMVLDFGNRLQLDQKGGKFKPYKELNEEFEKTTHARKQLKQ